MNSKGLYIITRYGIAIALISLLAVTIAYSMVRTTIIDADKWNARADSALNRVELIQPMRGEIYADDGSILATNLTAYTIAMDYRAAAARDTAFVASLDSLCDSMAVYYPKRTREQWKIHLATPLKKEPKKRTRYHVLLRDVTYADYKRILDFPFFRRYKKKKYAHGLCYSSREVRVMPYGPMASRSIGRCTYVQIPKVADPKSNKDSMEVLRGYSGLESALDSLLFGQLGTNHYVQLTRKLSTLADKPPVKGYSVRTTININMQDIVENELHDMLQRTEADWGTCILMDVATGDIKAISNLDRDKDGNYIEAMNYALQAYEPGSVMKPISMLIALEDGYAFPLDRHMEIGSTYAYAGGPAIHDTHSPATLPVSRFIEYSSNIGMTKLMVPHYENNLNGFRERLRRIGFFDKFNTGMAGERTPYFPTLDVHTGGRVSLSRMVYGYSTMIPPMYICAFYNAIANGGRFVRPRLYSELIDANGNVTKLDVSYVRDSICSRTNAQILLDMLHGVVHGTGGTARSMQNDVVNVVGKTGTSRIALERKDGQGPGYQENSYRLAFCGIFPYDNPKYTCMVLISNPSEKYRGAALTSGAVVKNIAIKMHARGMLDNSHQFVANPDKNNRPIMHASDEAVADNAKKHFGFSNIAYMPNPARPADANTVPDVKGLGLREAVARVEEAGYNIRIVGHGSAKEQAPASGTRLKKGSTVTVTFSSK